MNQRSKMKTVLIVDDEMDFLICSKNFLNVYAEQIEVLVAANGQEALHILDTTSVDLLVTDIKMPVMDGVELLTHLSKKHLDIAVIVITAHATKENLDLLNKVGQFFYLKKPFQLETLGKKILSLLKENSGAYLSRFTLTNLLQLIEMEEKTCTLLVTSEGKSGYLYLEKGELINAELNGFDGKEAASEIISWEGAETEIQGVRPKERKIHSPLMSILLEATRLRDENRTIPYCSDLLDRAIQMAEGHHFKEAKKILTRFLKNQPRNCSGWLWYSRISDSRKAIELSLANAAKIAPGNSEVVTEINNLKQANKTLASGQFSRCSFCWLPLEIGAEKCPACGGYLSISGQLLRSDSFSDTEILKKAVDRYTRVIEREKNSTAHYYLSVAHLNLKNWDDALTHLDKATKLAPSKQSYANQLQILLNHMASTKAIAAKNRLSHERQPDQIRTSVENIIRKNKILVVEDSTTTRKVISITLSQNGYEIMEAGDGLEALSKLNEAKPDLILLDIILPKMDGYKILSIIKENSEFEKIPVILLTSKDGILNKVKGRVAGSAAYLTKPFDPARLVATIERHLN